VSCDGKGGERCSGEGTSSASMTNKKEGDRGGQRTGGRSVFKRLYKNGFWENSMFQKPKWRPAVRRTSLKKKGGIWRQKGAKGTAWRRRRESSC